MPATVIPPLTVVLDMDELLVHAYHVLATNTSSGTKTVLLQLRPPHKKSQRDYGTIAKRQENNIELKVEFVKRPGLDDFFKALIAEPVDLYIWTASEKLYADTILDHILPEELKSTPRLYRQDCKVIRGKNGREIFYKDLAKNWPLAALQRVVLFDDNEKNFVTCPDNGIECLKWLGNLKDEPGNPEYLSCILDTIRKLITEVDVRLVSKKYEEELRCLAEEAEPFEKPSLGQSLVTSVSQSFFGLNVE